jgi:hypothetical protein
VEHRAISKSKATLLVSLRACGGYLCIWFAWVAIYLALMLIATGRTIGFVNWSPKA